LVESHKDPDQERALWFSQPRRVICCQSPSDVLGCLAEVESAIKDGCYVAGFMAYEAGYGLSPKLATLKPPASAEHALWFGVYERMQELRGRDVGVWLGERAGAEKARVSALSFDRDSAQYRSDFEQIQAHLHAGDSYQVNRSMEAFINGGLWGRGPGEGRIKDVLPDAHADFVFAVAGEEFGVVFCVLLVGLFAFIVLRGFSRLVQENNLFVLLSATGLLIQFGLQAIINMASTLHLIPTKGMTLPFLSYGGSSMLAISLGMGMMLALTRRRLSGGDL